MGIEASLTAVLVIITAFYAYQTWKMTQASATMAETAARSLDDAHTARLREKSETAARRCLDALWDFDMVLKRRPPAGATSEDCRRLYAVLDTEGGLILDTEVRRRVQSCGQVAYTAGWQDTDLERDGITRGMAVLVLRQVTRPTTATVAAYLREADLPPWGDLPAPGEELSWFRRHARTE